MAKEKKVGSFKPPTCCFLVGYACFVLDPEGNNIEAVLHDHEG